MARAGDIVAFDVETTGLPLQRGHRVIEIGAVRISSERKQRIIDRLLWPDSRTNPQEQLTFVCCANKIMKYHEFVNAR